MRKYAVIVAGGSGLRMGTTVPKQFLKLHEKPVLHYTVSTFLQSYPDLQVILVLPENSLVYVDELVSGLPDGSRVTITTGGDTRFDSVRRGLQLIQQHSIVFVHDGVRCLLTPQLVHRCYQAALEYGNAIPAIAAVDSIRILNMGRNETIDRNKVRMIQTPQTFFSEIIKTAFDQEYDESFTDEASVVERIGVKIHLVEGEITNIKLTQPLDMLIAEKILEERLLIS